MIIGERARQAIVERATAEGKDAIAYAEEIGISKASFKNWLKQCEPRAYSLSLMAEAGLDVHWILTGKRVDKVEVVRCKGCMYYDAKRHRCDHPNLNYDVECYDQWIDTEPDDFCSYGERRSENAAH